MDDRDKRQVNYIDTIDDQECYEKCQLTSSCTAFAYAYSIIGKDCYLYGSGPYTRGNGFAYTKCYIMPPLGTYHQRYRNIHLKKLKRLSCFIKLYYVNAQSFSLKLRILGVDFQLYPSAKPKKIINANFLLSTMTNGILNVQRMEARTSPGATNKVGDGVIAKLKHAKVRVI